MRGRKEKILGSRNNLPTHRALAALQWNQAGDMEGMIATGCEAVWVVAHDWIQTNGTNFLSRFLIVSSFGLLARCCGCDG
jgi:hypothetical protein